MLIGGDDRSPAGGRDALPVNRDVLCLATGGDGPVIEAVLVLAHSDHRNVEQLVHSRHNNGLFLVLAVQIGQHIASVAVLVDGSDDIA